ncbi:hypothetical protein ACFWWS_35580 [Streptomyces sp. NPDC059083]|uniref:hypothetical protein n=1 Tax=Streptomyces sp. NPDC059083 TaxID=3346721 RepID=UPI003698BE10
MSDNTVRTTDVTAALSPVDLLADDILANPEIAGLYPDPAAVIVELAARARHLRTRLGVVTSDWHTAGEQLTAVRAECRNLAVDNERLTDAALWYAAKLGITGRPALKA